MFPLSRAGGSRSERRNVGVENFRGGGSGPGVNLDALESDNRSSFSVALTSVFPVSAYCLHAVCIHVCMAV